MTRVTVPGDNQDQVLLLSGRRCCICFSLHADLGVKQGQIAHLDQDNTNFNLDNLAWLCLPHHDQYDSKTSQSKGFRESEVKKYRTLLYDRIGVFTGAVPVTAPQTNAARLSPNIHEGKVHAVGIHMDSTETWKRGMDERNRYMGARLLEIVNRLDGNRTISSVRVKAHLRLRHERNQEIVACPAVWLNERNEIVEIPAGEVLQTRTP
jgi:hypothetical protein